jgi:hypothetical protein
VHQAVVCEGFADFEEFLQEWGAPVDGFAANELDALMDLWNEQVRIADSAGGVHQQDHGTPGNQPHAGHKPAISQP